MVEELKTRGAALVGVAPLEPLIDRPLRERAVRQAMPGAESVLVFATSFPRGSLDAAKANPRPARFTLHALYAEGEALSLHAARLLEREGYSAALVPPYLPVEMGYETLGLVADVNLKHAAALAGLGSRGASDLLITAEHGPRVRLFGVITDAELEPTRRPGDPVDHRCTACGACAKACPGKAIKFKKGEPKRGTFDPSDPAAPPPGLRRWGCDPRACAPNSMRHGLPTLVAFIDAAAREPDPEKRLKKLKGPRTWEYWQALSQGSFYHCFECVRVCPVGRRAAS